MKLATPYRRREGEHLGPLVDVVFLLLLFFLLVGHISAPDPLAVEPPHSTAARPMDQGKILILLTANGRTALNDEEVEYHALGALLKIRLATTPNPRVDVKADAGVATGEIIKLMHVLRDAGVQAVRLLTQSAIGREHRP